MERAGRLASGRGFTQKRFGMSGDVSYSTRLLMLVGGIRPAAILIALRIALHIADSACAQRRPPCFLGWFPSAYLISWFYDAPHSTTTGAIVRVLSARGWSRQQRPVGAEKPASFFSHAVDFFPRKVEQIPVGKQTRAAIEGPVCRTSRKINCQNI